MDDFSAPFEVRDHRRKEMYRVDDEYLNGYARLCGIFATGVYNCLCRHANHLTQTSFPSVETMADKLDISRDSVIRGLKNLEKWNIIKKEKSRSAKTGEWIHNSYTLIDKDFWVPKTAQVADSNVAPGRSQRLHQVAHSDSKDANRKDANKYTANAVSTSLPDGFTIEIDGTKQPRTSDSSLKKYNELCDWLSNLTGAPMPTRTKQYRHLKDAKAANITIQQIKERAEELWAQKFYQENGMDWGAVVNSFNRRG